MKWIKMLTILNNCRKSDILTVNWGNGLVIKGVIDTFSETDNGLDEANPDYKEYYMCVIEITDIVKLPYNYLFNKKIGDLVELSEVNEPMRIELDNGEVIWEKQD